MVVSRCTVKLATDMEKIESKSYTVLGKNVTFSFDLLPGETPCIYKWGIK